MATKRTAFATVENNTDEPLFAVSLVHKYSDVYKNSQEWGIIRSAQSGSPPAEVEYNTGLLTTGVNWWLVSWYSADMKTRYFSSPNNFRKQIDWAEGIAPDTISAAAGAIAGILTVEAGPAAVVAAATAAGTVAKATTSAIFNSESTAGFKQHILREVDQGRTVKIIINQDRTIEIASTALLLEGNSHTVWTSEPVA